jgi:ATP-dependent DNA helicase RecG
MDITKIKGIGEKTAALFRKLDINTIEDLLHYYPRRYDTFTQPQNIEEAEKEGVGQAALSASVSGYAVLRKVRQKQITICEFVDENHTMVTLTWYNMPYLKQQLHKGDSYVVRGKLEKRGLRYYMDQPVLYKPEAYLEKITQMQPVYGLTKGLTNNMITKAVKEAFAMAALEPEFLPVSVRQEYGLAEYSFAMENVHFPINWEALIAARGRLVFDEFFLFITALRCMKEETAGWENQYPITDASAASRIEAGLPYTLTPAQKHVFAEIKQDMAGKKSMNRLIQGDVGCGKTIIAILALACVADAGYQGALMVPTEVLAKQHYESITSLFESMELPYGVALLTGSMTAKEKRQTYERIAANEVQIVIGTHALIQEKVIYDKLALVITDEQHRFGVHQRERLMEKGNHPHVLVMSATPIPRTLAIILYGDLDISVIDTLPANRLPIKNAVVNQDYRHKAYRFMEKEIRKGRQVYVICPMVEASESVEGEDVMSYTQKLREVFPADITIGTLHGKMKADEKNTIMEEFSSGRIQILVSTTVVEVGVNVPNATVMMVENAQRFGLAGLHQLRGRVGRGKEQSYCIFVCTSDKEDAVKRLEILKQSSDGFYIANEDLKMRGPGDLFGIRQSGDLAFSIADIYQDADVMKQAAMAAEAYEKGTLVCTDLERSRINRKLQAQMEKYSNQMSL